MNCALGILERISGSDARVRLDSAILDSALRQQLIVGKFVKIISADPRPVATAAAGCRSMR